MNDLRYAVRVLSKSPGFTVVTVGLLAVGIGSSAVMFSAFDAVILRPLPVPHPEELVRMVQKTPQLGARSSFPYLYYEALRDHSTTLSAVFGEQEMRVALNEPRPAEQIQVNLVTPEFFQVLGAAPLYGRTLMPEDASDTPGPIPAVLSHGFWQRRFKGDPRGVGRTITLHGHAMLIVGVMRREFNGTSMDTSPDVRLPLRALLQLSDASDGTRSIEDMPNLALAGRLKRAVRREQAQAECLALWRGTLVEYARRHSLPPASLETELRRGMGLDPLDRGTSLLRERFGSALKTLIGLVGVLLLMVCGNVAGLLLARGASTQEQIATRIALGATSGRLIRQMLTESALLAVMGSAAGWLLAVVATPLFVRALPPLRDLYTARVALSLDVAPDRRVLLFSIVLTAMTVLLFGLAPAVLAVRTSVESALRGMRSIHGWRGRQVLIVTQIASCTVLLAGAGLLARTMKELRSLDPGFDTDHLVTFTADPSLAGYQPAQARALRLALMERVREIPGVESVAVASRPVMRGSGLKMTVAADGHQPSAADFLNTSTNSVTPGYFGTMGMRILDGRDLTAADEPRPDGATNVVINQAFAAKFFPGESPVGRRFKNTGSSGYVVIGVVSDAKYRSLREPMTPTFYSSWRDSEATDLQLEVRTRVQPQTIIQPVREALAALDPALPFTEIETMAGEMDTSLAGEKMTAGLASMFGGLAAALAAIGIYGLLAYMVAQRRREIGIRMALGARARDITGMLGRQVLVLVVIGVGVGLSFALIIAPWIRALLYGITPTDPMSLMEAGLLVAAVAAVAAAYPAFSAIRVDPASVLRQEGRGGR